MTPEEFQKWLKDNNTKYSTALESICKTNLVYNEKKAFRYIKVGAEYWFYNLDNKKGPGGWYKLKVTFKRSNIIFFIVDDERYLVKDEEYADVDSYFVRNLHPAIFKNPNPEYFKSKNFDTLDGKIKII